MKNFRTFLNFCAAIIFLASTSFAQEPPNEGKQRLLTSDALNQSVKNLVAEAVSKKWSFTPRVTGVSDRSLQSLTGEVQPTARQIENTLKIDAITKQILETYSNTLKQAGRAEMAGPGCASNASKWDWRKFKKVTKPKLQQCGDCWAFATAGQIESAHLMAGWTEQDLSEQQVLDCSNSGDCGGGRRWDALSWATATGTAVEDKYSSTHPGYLGVLQQCDIGVLGSSKLIASGWVDSSGNVPPPEVLKKAICDYGPISVSIYASAALQNYGGSSSEVFDENNNNNGTNHAVLLVGWDDEKQAWLMKNSWGERWGIEGGLAWIKYGTNNVGKWAVWAKAPEKNLALPPIMKQQIKQLNSLWQMD
ncbi:MAG TPA: C1 family peptidase [Aestuariivirga sp.]|nr:C1 family peptidase [Aestuariivirga sp.]